MQPRIQVRSVSKIYGSGAASVQALVDIALDVAASEVIMLVGPSGSGKTTLLSIMGAILRPSAGSVKINGREIANLDEKQLPAIRLENIGFIFQGFNLFPALTVGENVEIAFNLRGTRGARARSRAADLLERVGLADKIDAYPENLSGGQKQRVAIARALAGDPPILLADEPTGNLDWASGRSVMEMLSSLARTKDRSVVIVTHDPRALPYGDRIVHLADGRIQNDSPIEELETAGAQV